MKQTKKLDQGSEKEPQGHCSLDCIHAGLAEHSCLLSVSKRARVERALAIERRIAAGKVARVPALYEFPSHGDPQARPGP